MAVSAKDVLQQFYVKLTEVLPLESDQFFAIIKNAGLLPLDTGDNIRAERTRSAKVSYLLSHVIEPEVQEYLPLLLKTMEDSKAPNVVKLAQEIRAALGVTHRLQHSLSMKDEDPVLVEKLWSQEELEQLFHNTKDQVTLPSNIQDEVLEKIVVLLVTVNINETLATRSYLKPLDGHENIYKFSKRDDFNQLREVATYYIGKYGECPTAIRVIPPWSQVLGGASSVPRMALGCFPHLGAIIGVGVACGVEKKVKMCDVLVSSKVVNYDQVRIQHGEFTSQGQAINGSEYLLTLFTELVNWPNDSFKKRLQESKMDIPKVKSGVILSGPYLIDDAVMKQLRIKDFAQEAIGVEMEGAYLFAASRPASTDVILVKAVCDFGDGKKDKAYQPTAALMAADWVHTQLSNPQVPDIIMANKVELWSEDIIKKVYRDYYSLLVQTLPMEDAIFVSLLYTKNLLSGDLRDQVTSKNTCAEKAEHFLDNAIEESLYFNFSLLLNAMIEHKSMITNNLAKQIKQELDSHVSSDSAQVTEKRNKEIQETMLKARDAKYSVPIRYGKVLFCGAAAAGKSNFLNLLMKEDFQKLHISTEVLKPQQVTIAMKTMIYSSDDKVEFKRMQIDDEILQLESYLPKKFDAPTAPLQKSPLQVPSQDNPPADNLPRKDTTSTASSQRNPLHTPLEEHVQHSVNKPSTDISELALANVKTNIKKLNEKAQGVVWDILTFMDTGGQPQFISMLPAVNSFAMITFIVHKMETGGQDSFNKIVKVQYGNEKGEISYKPHPHKYTYLQLIETLISYASNILPPNTKFLDKVKMCTKECENIRSIVLTGTHSGDDQLSEDDLKKSDEELTKVVNKSGVNHIKPNLNKNYEFLVPVDNKKQGKNCELQVTKKDTRRYTDPSDIRKYIQDYLTKQAEIHVPIKWLLLELEMRKICQQRNCNLLSYSEVVKLATDRKLGYDGEFGDDVDIDNEQFIKQGLRFHHSFGVLLYFEDVEGMQKLVITNHQWLFNKLSKIVEYSFTREVVQDTKDLKNGIFRETLLDKDCLDIKKDFEESHIDVNLVNPINAFLKLLEHLHIAAPLNENPIKYFMPCILKSCELSDLKEKVPQCMANGTEPLLIQFKSTDNNTYSFPRGVLCFLVVELMVSRRWEPCKQAYVNFITLLKKDTAHYITLIDRIFCLEVHVSYKKDNNIHNEVREIINKALHTVGTKLKIDCNLCHGFTCCACQDLEEVHISYLSEDIENYCFCEQMCETSLIDSHNLWLTTYFKKPSSIQQGDITLKDNSSNCKSLELKLRDQYSKLSNLPYESMNIQLFAKSVITSDEKRIIDKETGTKQMSKVLDVIITSLKLNQITKFEGFLEAMEESDDTALKETAKKLKALATDSTDARPDIPKQLELDEKDDSDDYSSSSRERKRSSSRGSSGGHESRPKQRKGSKDRGSSNRRKRSRSREESSSSKRRPVSNETTSSVLEDTVVHKVSENEILKRKPEMVDLTKIVIPKIMNEWEYVAEAFRYDLDTIEAIKKEKGGDAKKCCREFFRDWLMTDHGRRAGPKEWSTLLNVLEEVHDISAETTEDIATKVKELNIID